jgi:hypothetical protein
MEGVAMGDQPVLESEPPQLLALARITRDPALEMRQDGLDAKTIAEYATEMEAGVAFDAVVVYRDDEDRHWLSRGFHRCAAAELAGFEEVWAVIRPGTRQDALWDAFGSNREWDAVGRRRTRADKRRAVEGALGARPGLSDRAIAEHVGVDPTWVGRLRKEASGVDNLHLNPSTRIGADGKVYPAHSTKSVQAPPVSPPAPSNGGAPPGGRRGPVTPARVRGEDPPSVPIPPVTPPAPPDDDVGEIHTNIAETPDLDNNVDEVAVDRPGELPDSPPPVTPAPVTPAPVTPAPASLLDRFGPVSLTSRPAPVSAPAGLPASPAATSTPALVSGYTPASMAAALRARATPDFVLDLIWELAVMFPPDELQRLVQRLADRILAAVGDEGG